MKAILGYQEVVEIVEDKFQVLSEKAIDVDRMLYRENKKCDLTLSFLYINVLTMVILRRL